MRTRSNSASSPNIRSLRSRSRSLNHETKKLNQRKRAQSAQLRTKVKKVQKAVLSRSKPDYQNVFSDQENHSSTRSHETDGDDDDDDNESLGDDDLPAVEFDSSTAKSKVKELVPGTMVWAKSRGWPHWPAVLIKMCTNNTKAWVNYLDKKNQRVQVGARSMAPFFGPKRDRFIENGKASSFSEYFLKSLENAEDYLIKQGLGKIADSPCRISSTSGFCNNISPISSYRMPISPSSSHNGSHDRSHDGSHDAPHDILHEGPQETSAPEPNKQKFDLSSDEELRIGHPVHRHSKTDKANDETIQERKKSWQHVATRLLKYIRRKTTKNHLLAIYNGQTKSERHRLFSSKRAKDREKLRLMAGLGPIADDDLQNELTSFIGDLYIEHCMECKDDIPNTSYITEVWLPEAIIFAIQKTRRIGRKNAEKLFRSECVQSLLDLGEDMPDVSSIDDDAYDEC